jgi:hypothetical protein
MKRLWKKCERRGDVTAPMTRESLWMISHWKTRDNFFADPRFGNPWAEMVAARTPNPTRPRLLFLGCRPDLDHYLGSKTLSDICRTHGLRRRETRSTRHIESFWRAFYGSQRFLQSRVKYIPSLIVTTGRMRFYGDGTMYTFSVLETLEDIAKRWGIPLEVVPEIPYPHERESRAPDPTPT